MFGSQQSEHFECIHCLGTYYGTTSDILRLGWKHPHKAVWLCKECVQMYDFRRKLKPIKEK